MLNGESVRQMTSKLKDIQFFVAPSSTQWCNGKAVADFAQAKILLRKMTGHFGTQSFIFQSSFKITELFIKICAVLNDRPIFYGADSDFYVSVKTLTFPGLPVMASWKNSYPSTM